MTNNERLAKLKEMEQAKPTDPFLKFAIALEYLSQSQLIEAQQQFESLIKHYPSYLPTYYQAGKLYEDTGNILQATRCYQAGIELAKTTGDTKTTNELKEALSLLADE